MNGIFLLGKYIEEDYTNPFFQFTNKHYGLWISMNYWELWIYVTLGLSWCLTQYKSLLKLDNIINDMSKARHLYWSVRQPCQLFELYHLSLKFHCIRYELPLFMAKAFPLLKLIMTSTGWGAVSKIF